MPKRPRTGRDPDRLTLLSLSTLLTVEDTKDLETMVWDTIAKRTWIAYAAMFDHGVRPFILVEAESRDEALLELFASGFYRLYLSEIHDYCFCEDCQVDSDDSGEQRGYNGWCAEDCDHPGFPLFVEQYSRCAHDPSKDTLKEILKHVPRAEVIATLKWWAEISMQPVYRLSDIVRITETK